MKTLAALLLCGLAAQGMAADAAPLRSRAVVSDEINGAKQDLKLKKRKLDALHLKERKDRQAEASIVQKIKDSNRKLDLSNRDAKTSARNLAVVEDLIGIVRRRSAGLQVEEGGLKQRMAARLVALYKAGPLRPAALLFSSRSAAELISRWRFLRELAHDDQRRLGEARRSLTQIEEYGREYKRREAELGKARRDDESARAKAERERRVLQGLYKRAQASTAQSKAMVANAEKDFGELQGLMNRLRSEISTATGGRPSAPSAGGPSFVRGRRSLLWPVAGRVLSYFGEHKHPRFNTKIFNRGVEIAAPLGAEVKAVAEGDVKYAEYFEGFGQMVILDHGGGMLSVYGRNSSVEVGRDQHVLAGQKIAEVGDQGSGPSLYFEIRKEAKPLDPLQYLKRR